MLELAQIVLQIVSMVNDSSFSELQRVLQSISKELTMYSDSELKALRNSTNIIQQNVENLKTILVSHMQMFHIFDSCASIMTSPYLSLLVFTWSGLPIALLFKCTAVPV